MSTVNILITGGTGLIGRELSKELVAKGYGVMILTRSPKKSDTERVEFYQWNIEKQFIDPVAIAKADYIIHLAGEGVADKRWSKKRKKEILESRTESGKLLVKAVNDNPANKIKAVVSSSAIGYYGEDPAIPNPNPFTENDPPDEDFLGETCRLWEASTDPFTAMGKRLVKIRTGIVLSREGGALKEFIKPLKFGIASILGSGRQMISWIHIQDLCRIYIDAIENGNLNGVYNAVAPRPVSNKTLTLQLAKSMRGQFYIPLHVPSFALKMALGEMSTEVLKSTSVSAGRISATGFTFLYPSIESAIEQLVKTSDH
ncbi:MAG: TIGR01777 family protein [Gemmatimonadaceae bacterium]|nr:TIGR01777 family protein [Chitinophagaceae bacterium]